LNFALYIDNPWIGFGLALALLFFGFVVVRFGIRVFGLALGGFFGFIGLQVVEVWTGTFISAWVYLAAAAAGGVLGALVIPVFARAGVMFFSFLFGLFLPEITGWLRDFLSFPGSMGVIIGVRLALGVLFLILASQLFLQIIVVLSALVGASLLAELIGAPGFFLPLLAVGLLAQFFFLRRFLPPKRAGAPGGKDKRLKKEKAQD